MILKSDEDDANGVPDSVTLNALIAVVVANLQKDLQPRILIECCRCDSQTTSSGDGNVVIAIIRER